MNQTYFRQLLDAQSGTFTYLLADTGKSEAVLIDPVLHEVAFYLRLLGERALHLALVIDTHLHDDHVTAAWALRERTRARTVAGNASGIEGADILVGDGESLAFGDEELHAIATPGHTPGCMSYLWRDRVFTGDALLIGGCGRSDPPLGNAGRLYDSLTRRLLDLSDETLVCPGHGSGTRRISCIGDERATNPCLAGLARDEFVAARRNLGPPPPAARESILSVNRNGGDPRAIGAPGARVSPSPLTQHH
jgi:glyoxylase-like metal-dependent hydrolase (beta-lactamase superfamily II)